MRRPLQQTFLWTLLFGCTFLFYTIHYEYHQQEFTNRKALEKCQQKLEVLLPEKESQLPFKDYLEEESDVLCNSSFDDLQIQFEEEKKKAVSEARLSLAQSTFQADISTLKRFLKKYKGRLENEWNGALKQQSKRGILFLAGPPLYTVNTYVSLYAIRNYWNCTLPVVVMYWGETEDISLANRELFQKDLGNPPIQFIDASTELPWPSHHRQLFLSGQKRHKTGWVMKVAAAYLVPFQEVLYLDADSAPVVHPESLFDLPEYKATGTLFFPDAFCVRTRIFNKLIDMLLIKETDAPLEDENETEAGQWLLDRRRHRIPLEFIMLMATHSEFTFAHSFGDKDLFRAGFALAGAAQDYKLAKYPMGFAWSPAERKGGTLERFMRGYIQYSDNGQPLFHHRAGWETKYIGPRPEGRPLEAISGPLPCNWTMQNWPLDFPGIRNDSALVLVDKKSCPYSVDNFGKAISECNENFHLNAWTGEPMPIYSIAGSVFQQVHKSMEQGWHKLVTENARKNYKYFQV